jgi:hypothetical protein
LEVYDPCYGSENYAELILKYNDPSTGKTLAKSRWNSADDNTQHMKECEVIKFLPQEDLFTIEWLHNKKRKKVARFNLQFLKEN